MTVNKKISQYDLAIINMAPEYIPEFWRRVDRKAVNKCWFWKGSMDNGYGTFWTGKKSCLAHRVSFFISNNRLPTKPNEVIHQCETRNCVNPSHLLDGTRSENIRSPLNYKRLKTVISGEKNPIAKLTEQQVIEIFLSKKGLTELGKMYDINPGQIWRIKSGKHWAYLTKSLMK